MQQSPRCSGKAHVDVGDPQFHRPVGTLLGKIDVVHADHFASACVDNLLVEQIPFTETQTYLKIVYDNYWHYQALYGRI